MYDAPLKSSEGLEDVLENHRRLAGLHGAAIPHVVPQRQIGPWHREHPVVLELTGGEDRDHVGSALKLTRQQ